LARALLNTKNVMTLIKEIAMRKTIFALLLAAVVVGVTGCDDNGNDVIYYGGEIPMVPTGVYTVTRNESIQIVWQANHDGAEPVGYGVYRRVRVLEEVEEYELIATVPTYHYDDTLSYKDNGRQNGHTYYYAVNAYNEFGESELSYEYLFDTPRPDGSASVFDYNTRPETAGFDFSAFRPVDWEDPQADVFFEYDPDWDVFYVNVAGNDYESVWLQDYGYTRDIFDVNWGDPGGGWCKTGWLPLTLEHAYVVWTADNHFAAFRVNSLNSSTGRISIAWSYQTDPGNPELKLRPPEGSQHAENYGRREG
jgi:hypothetical protein